MAGLKLVSPSGQVYQSLDCAIASAVATTTAAAIPKDDSSTVDPRARMMISLATQFMAHVGSMRYEEVTDHFLIGRQYCADFYSNSTTNSSHTVLFGRIVACMGPVASTTTNNQPSSSKKPSSRTRANNKTTQKTKQKTKQQQQQQQHQKKKTARSQSNKLIFVVQYDPDILHHLSKTMNIKMATPPSSSIQFIPSNLAWGGCILYERKTCIRRDAATSVIQNIDRMTSVETWIVPDMRMEEEERVVVVKHPVEAAGMPSKEEEEENKTVTKERITSILPQLTVYTRGYKFMFRVKEASSSSAVDHSDGRERQQQQQRRRRQRQKQQQQQQQQYGVFVSCTTMPQPPGSSSNTGDQEINLKPGELIDLGILAPLRDEEKMDHRTGSGSDSCRKSLSSFLVKNFIHRFRPEKYAILSDDGNYVYDLTDDFSGKMKDVAATRLLSYIRRESSNRTSAKQRQHHHHPPRRQPPPPQLHPTIHTRLDPCGNVHLLFGIQYNGDWAAYENGMQQQFVPMFCGREVEVTTPSSAAASSLIGPGITKDVLESRYLQSISLFSIEEIVSCSEHMCQLVDADANLDQQYPSMLLERCEQVVKCLLDRIEQMRSMAVVVNRKMTDDDESRSSSKNNHNTRADQHTNSLLLPTFEHLNKLSQALNDRK